MWRAKKAESIWLKVKLPKPFYTARVGRALSALAVLVLGFGFALLIAAIGLLISIGLEDPEDD